MPSHFWSLLLLLISMSLQPAAAQTTSPQTTQVTVPQDAQLLYTTGWIEHTYEGDYYFAIVDSEGNVIQRLIELLPGTYWVFFSRPGFTTVKQSVQVSEGKATQVKAPALVPKASPSLLVSFHFTGVKNLVVLQTRDSKAIADTENLAEGDYNLLLVASTLQVLNNIKISGPNSTVGVPDWFVGFSAPKSTPQAQPSTPITPPSTATPPATLGPKMCWVNGYTRKNGTRVSGYWRRC